MLTKETLMEYDGMQPCIIAHLLNVPHTTLSYWMKKHGLNTNIRPKRGEFPGTLGQSIRAQGPEKFKEMTAEEISDETGFGVGHVRWAMKRFGFEYRHVKRGRKAEE